MKIFGLQKLTLIDYPGLTAATVFLSGCDFNCPFCHNAASMDLNNTNLINAEEVVAFFKTRIKKLEGVCISGGEPLLQNGIVDFIKEIKDIGFKIKLDTNGQNSEALKRLVESELVNYVAMDVKSSLQNYGKAIGLDHFDTKQVEESAGFLRTGIIPYEFRTTVVRELHTVDDFYSIGEWLQNADKYFLQKYKDSEGVPVKNLSAYNDEEMKEFCEVLTTYNINTCVRK